MHFVYGITTRFAAIKLLIRELHLKRKWGLEIMLAVSDVIYVVAFVIGTGVLSYFSVKANTRIWLFLLGRMRNKGGKEPLKNQVTSDLESTLANLDPRVFARLTSESRFQKLLAKYKLASYESDEQLKYLHDLLDYIRDYIN